LYGLASRTPYDGLPTWAELMGKPAQDRLAALNDDGLLRRLAAEAERLTLSGPLAPKDPAKLYLMPPGEARYDVRAQNSLAAEAARRGTTPAGAFLEYLKETGGQGLLYYPVLNSDLDAVAEMITNPDVVIGLGDAGAHVALTMDAGQPTYVLAHWVRDEQRLDLGQAIHKLTHEGAELFGISGRGLLAPGAFADVNVIDLAALRLRTPELVSDFPLGASRYVQRADGYDYTLVNGEVLVDHGELTDARPGRLVTGQLTGRKDNMSRHEAVIVAGGVQSSSTMPVTNRRVPGSDTIEEDWLAPSHRETPDAPIRDMSITVGRKLRRGDLPDRGHPPRRVEFHVRGR
jgi:N-acyl-D-amino-acid deacylase